MVRGLANRQLLQNFVSLGPRVLRYHAARCIRPSVMHLFVGCAVDEIDELWQQISRRAVARKGQNLIWDLDTRSPGSPLGRQNIEGCNKICGTLLYITRGPGSPLGRQNSEGCKKL